MMEMATLVLSATFPIKVNSQRKDRVGAREGKLQEGKRMGKASKQQRRQRRSFGKSLLDQTELCLPYARGTE